MSASGTSEAAHAAAHGAGLPSNLSLADTHLLLASLPCGVLALAPDGTVAVLNPVAEALWGVPVAAVLGHLPAQVQPAVLPPALLRALAPAPDASADATYWLPHTRQWIAMRTAPAAEGRRWVYWDNVTASQSDSQATQQQAPGNLPAAIDTQEYQLLAQAALRETQERYRTLFEGMSQGFCVVKVLFDDAQQAVDYRFLVTNPAFEQQTGLRHAVGQTMRALRPGHETYWFELYGEVARTGEPQRFARPAEQLGRFYEVYAFRVGDPAEHKVGILFRDISEAQRTEEALRESEESYRTLFNSIDEGYFLCDVLFDEQHVPVDIFYRDANPAATRLMGSDFRGRRMLDIDPGYEDYWVEIFGRVAQTGVGERLERYAGPDQKWYDFYISKVGDEASRRVAVVFQDITERKQHEQALRASEAQQAADLAGMRRLYELQAKLANEIDLQVAFQEVLAVACEFTGTDRGCVQFLSSDGQRLEMFVWQGYAEDSPFINFFRYEGLETGCEVARVQRKRLIIEDTVGFEGLEGTEAGAASYADGIRAAQSTPMTSRTGETIGVISTQFRQPHRPSEHELRLLDMLAWTAAEYLERHRADAARRESEQQFRLMADAVPQIVWITDADGHMKFFNQQWSDYTGVPKEPTTATEAVEGFVHPDDGAATIAAFTEARATGTTFLVEHRIRSRSGDYRWFLVRAEPYREASTGEIIRWFGASVDIHDRKQAEVALEKAHERLKLAMNVGRIFSFEMIPETRALELSDNVDTVIGFPLPDHIDSTFQLIHPDDLQPTVDLINGAIDSRGSYASNYRLVNPASGEVAWFHSQAAFTRINASGEWRFVGIAQNITESKRAEEALRESEAKYRTLFNSIDEGYYLLEVIFNEHGEAADVLYLDANPASIRMSGGDRRGKTLREVGQYEAYWYELFGRVARTGVSERTEQFSSVAGIWVNTYTFKVGEQGNKVATIFRDVTERKRREANLAFLADVADEMSRLSTVDEMMAAVGAKIAAHMNIAAVNFIDIDDAGGLIHVNYGWAQPNLPSVLGTFRMDEMLNEEWKRANRAGEMTIIGDTQTDARTNAAAYAPLRIGAFVNVPFNRAGEWKFILSIYDTGAHDWRADEIELFRELSNRVFPRLERARAEAALRASEEKYRSLFETMDQGFAVCELLRDETGRAIDFRYLELNPMWEQQTGLSRDRALGCTVRELIPGIEEWWVQAYACVVDSGEPTRFEYQVGSLGHWYQVLAFPQDGQRFAVIYDDITDRKKAEATMQQSETRQAYLLALSDALNSVGDAVGMQAAVTNTAMDYFQADRCYYGEVAGDTVTIRCDAARPGLPSVAAVYSLSTMPIFQALLQEIQPVVVADAHTSVVMDDNLKELCLGFGIMAYINVPVTKNGERVGLLCLTQSTPREWTALEVDLVQETAERTWAAVERANAEEALRESEALLQKAFSIDTVGLLYFTLDGGVTAANAAFARMSGYRREELLALEWNVLTAPEYWEITTRHAGELADKGETAPYEKQFVRPDGSRWWGLCAPTRLKGEGPTAECVEFVVDITPRKQAEQQLQAFTASLEQQITERTLALRENQDLLQLVFDTSLMALSVQEAVRDAHGIIQDFRVVFLNKELARELNRSDMVGKHYVEEYPGLKASGLFDLMRTTVETGEPQHMEYYYPYEGFNRWFSCTFVKLNDGVVATNLDITTRKQAEEERFRHFALLQQSEEVAGLGSWDYHVSTGAFVWSDGMYRLFDLPLGTPVTPHFYLDVVVAEDRPIAERLVHKILGEPSSFEKQLRVRVAGQVKTLRLKAEVLRDATGQPVRVLGVDLDISEVQRLEADNLHLRLSQQQALFEAVQQAQEMERKRLAEGLHNGVGQLLFATKLRLDRLHSPVLAAEPALAAARREADRLLAEAIRQTRVLSHELVPTVLEEFGLAKALQDVCRQLSTPQLPLRCHVLLDEEVPPLPPLLQLALYRMAQELGLNIVKHARGATEASLELETTPGFVLLRAEDNGPGFSTDLAASLGLGLRTIRDRVALLDGTLELGHEAGLGTFVRLRIPLPVLPTT